MWLLPIKRRRSNDQAITALAGPHLPLGSSLTSQSQMLMRTVALGHQAVIETTCFLVSRHISGDRYGFRASTGIGMTLGLTLIIWETDSVNVCLEEGKITVGAVQIAGVDPEWKAIAMYLTKIRQRPPERLEPVRFVGVRITPPHEGHCDRFSLGIHREVDSL